MSQRALSKDQFAGHLLRPVRLLELPEKEDEPLASERAPGRRVQDLAPRGTAELRHHPYAPELREPPE